MSVTAIERSNRIIRRRKQMSTVLRYVVLFAVGFIMMYPLLWMVGSSLKADNNEISTKPLDLRGLIGALKTVQAGLSPRLAIRMGVVNKSFDLLERELVEDIVMTRIPESWTPADIFED